MDAAATTRERITKEGAHSEISGYVLRAEGQAGAGERSATVAEGGPLDRRESLRVHRS